jgi:outer membrane biosynthesis protein TonB
VVLGPRFLIQAGFIIAVAVVAGIERVGTWSIIGLVAAAWILVAIVELGMWARHANARRPAAERSVHAERGLTEVEPPPAPPPAAHRLEPMPVPTPEPPRIAAAPPPPEPEPEPEPAAEPEPEPTVAYLPLSETPREWNLWELERATRDHTTDDVARNEERAYLLMYLREFAGPDGVLPADFDGLVRDAFGDLLRVVST